MTEEKDLVEVVKELESKIAETTSHEEDAVNHPSHYETGKFECIEVMEEAFGKAALKEFCVLNAFKYLYRHKRKNGDEDIAKASWYLNKFQELNK